MRPSSIVNFERLSLLAVLIGVLTVVLSWNDLIASVRSKVLGSGLEPAVAILALIYIGLLVLLILLTARRASGVAKWLLILIVVAELVYTVPALGRMIGAGLVGWLELVQLIVQVVAVALLFTPASRDWFAGEPAR